VLFCISDGGDGGYEPANVFVDAVEAGV